MTLATVSTGSLAAALLHEMSHTKTVEVMRMFLKMLLSGWNIHLLEFEAEVERMIGRPT